MAIKKRPDLKRKNQRWRERAAREQKALREIQKAFPSEQARLLAMYGPRITNSKRED